MREWHKELATDLQKKKILSLMASIPRYQLFQPVEELNKGQAHDLITLLLQKRLDLLLERGMIKEDSPTQSKDTQRAPLRYKVSQGDDVAAYSVFRDKVKGRLIRYELDGRDIVFQIIEVKKEIPQEIIESSNLEIERLEE